jgi:hypothetical protein
VHAFIYRDCEFHGDNQSSIATGTDQSACRDNNSLSIRDSRSLTGSIYGAQTSFRQDCRKNLKGVNLQVYRDDRETKII